MKILLIPSSQGNLKTKECDKPESVLKFLSSKIKVINVPIIRNNISETNENILSFASSESQFVAIGGDHSITYPLFKGFLEHNPNSGIIIFDAHPDCHDDFGTHEDFVRNIYKLTNKIIIVGIRNWSKEEKRFLDNNKIKYFTMNEIQKEGLNEIIESLRFIINQWSSVYLSFDIDVVDPVFAPGTGYPEIGGLSSREAIYLVNELSKSKKIKSMDIVEVIPDSKTELLAAKLVDTFLKHKD